MSRVCLVTGFVPLPTKHVTPKYHDMAREMLDAASNHFTYVGGETVERCWAYKYKDLPPSHEVAQDRYNGPAECALSNAVQHERLIWAIEAAQLHPEADIFVWLDYGVLKQGDWKNRRVTVDHIYAFLARVDEMQQEADIPFPGIWDRSYGTPPDPSAPDAMDARIPWRFAGSTHIWPREYLHEIAAMYYTELDRYVKRTKSIPLDLPIWAWTELKTPWLPWRWYQADHDHTQLTNYYPIHEMTTLCDLSRHYGCDKGGRHLIAGDTCHEYTPAYFEQFRDKRFSVKRVLEIGVNLGCSLEMWSAFFPNAEIVGLDIDPRTLFQTAKIRTYQADQSSAVSLYKAMAAAGGEKFDIIIDDGSHVTEHQILTAQVLMPFLKPEGAYYIEDVVHDSDLESLAGHIGGDYHFGGIICPRGFGRAHDPETKGPEQLLVIRHG